MNAPANLPAPSAAPQAPAPRTQRLDGWTPERRGAFLTALAEGHSVEAACAYVALSPASAYALRRREEGFALGWAAACLLAREALADLLTSRAIDGQVDTYTRADGATVTRHRHDNRLGQAMLARLDRLAEVPAAGAAQPLGAGAARAVASDFGGFLDLVERAADADTIDEFVAARTLHTSQLPQLSTDAAADEEEEEPVWFDGGDEEWRTALPPPTGFKGEEFGDFGDEDYWRQLTPAEAAVAERRHEEAIAAERAEGERARERWFTS